MTPRHLVVAAAVATARALTEYDDLAGLTVLNWPALVEVSAVALGEWLRDNDS